MKVKETIHIESSLALVSAVYRHVTGSHDGHESELYQTSLMTALLQGVYEGDVTFADLPLHGDFGLGTFNRLDGEMIGLDGVFYQLKSDGSAGVVAPDQKTPFAVVTFFQAEKTTPVDAGLNKKLLSTELGKLFSDNLFVAVRVDGRFREVKTRTVAQQTAPYPPLIEATRLQRINTFEDVEGTLVGFRTPAFAQGIGVAGIHLHFICEDKKAGGHVLDFSTLSSVLSAQRISG